MTKKIKSAIPAISASDHAAYIKYHNQTATTEPAIAAAVLRRQALFLKSTPLDEKRRLLFLLGHADTLTAYETIQKYLKHHSPALAAWATLALQECASNLKGALLDEDQIGILGSMNNRLRFWLVISAQSGQPFTKKQKQLIARVYKKIAHELDSKIERVEFGKNYALITCLISNEVAPANIIERGLNECNDPLPFLRFHYYAVNTIKQTPEEIEAYVNSLS